MLTLDPASIEIVGYAAAILTTASFIPQVLRAWRTRSVRDLSPAMLAAFVSGVALWLVYGLAVRSVPVIAANAVTLVLNLVLVGLRIRYHDGQD